jgi:protein TonB
MEQPVHDLRAHAPAAGVNTGRRTAILIAVGVLHVGLVWALIAGLASGLIEKLPAEIKAEVIKPKEDKPPPPPPPPDLAKPPPPFVPPPEINIATDTPPNAITAVQPNVPTPPAPPPQPAATVAPTAPKPIGRTHSCDTYYPDASRRLNETGTVVVQYVVGADGSISNVTVRTSSGSDRLDQAALSCVQSRFRSEPGTVDGKPVAVTTASAIQFKFK